VSLFSKVKDDIVLVCVCVCVCVFVTQLIGEFHVIQSVTGGSDKTSGGCFLC
jgi:hypothetical protein